MLLFCCILPVAFISLLVVAGVFIRAVKEAVAICAISGEPSKIFVVMLSSTNKTFATPESLPVLISSTIDVT